MKKFIRLVYLIFSAVFLLYLALPNPVFPDPLPGSLQSAEPADVETSLRRGYYADQSRQEVLNYYQVQLKKLSFLNVALPTYRLNYPPEESQTLIRDQTRSTFLEEIVHPFRESFYINGYEPTESQNLIVVNDKNWRQKIIVKYVPSNPLVRISIYFPALILLWIILREVLGETAKLEL